MIAVDPLVCALIPIVLLIQEFTFPINFLLQVIGIMPSEETYATQVNELFEIEAKHLYNKFFKAAQASISGIFLGLLLSVNGSFESSFYYTAIICCGGAYFLVGFFLTNPIGKYFGKLLTSINSNILNRTVKNIWETEYAMSTMADSMKSINADYEHEVEFFEKVLIGFVLGGYGYIPGIGPILATFSEYISDPGLCRSGIFNLSIAYIFKIIAFICIIVGIMLGLKSDTNEFIILIVIFAILQFIDMYDEIAGMINDDNNWEIQKSLDTHIKKCCKKENKKLENPEVLNNKDTIHQLIEQKLDDSILQPSPQLVNSSLIGSKLSASQNKRSITNTPNLKMIEMI
ncbi:Conserved_hypothetical protein [Hexamita inflata]|uniref:Uncharacterized protein n=1 Tax=Hexamita inflata TaxID=28002 RepID=A0AA86RG64_9EUKA|nr:Conserved hypothetical protein [Hexamita inflata]